jgi:hypothetical protein
MFQLVLRQIDQPDGTLKMAWNVARGNMDSAYGLQALGELESEVKRRDDLLAKLEDDSERH